MSLHSLQCQWTLQMGTGNVGFSQQSIHRESERDLHLNVELPKNTLQMTWKGKYLYFQDKMLDILFPVYINVPVA